MWDKSRGFLMRHIIIVVMKMVWLGRSRWLRYVQYCINYDENLLQKLCVTLRLPSRSSAFKNPRNL
jgi:hypothetical protein